MIQNEHDARLARIETNVQWIVRELSDVKGTGWPRCCVHEEQLESLSKSVGTIKKILISACAIPILGGLVAKFIVVP